MVGALDYKGFPADRSKTGGWVPAAFILGIELVERLSTLGIGVNLVTYLVGTMHLPSATSANIVTDFMGTCFLLCLLGGFIADSFLGRYLTILIFSALQALGTGMLAIVSRIPQLHPPPCGHGNHHCEQANGLQMGVLYISLYLIALGTGGLKSSVSGFGTDQFDEKDEKERTQMAHFFSRFFFCISLGSLLAVTVLVYIQDAVGRSWAYAICSLSMIVAIAIFLFGTPRYRFKKSAGSPIVHILQVIMAAMRKRKRNLQLPQESSLLYEDCNGAPRIPHTKQFRFLDHAAIITPEDQEEGLRSRNPWKLCSVTRVEEVKMVVRMLPIWATSIMFWTTYAQMVTFSVEQATTMHRTLFGSFSIPPASLTVFFVGTILITLAVYDRLVNPLYRRFSDSRQPPLSNLQRIGLGLFLSIISMASAALIEAKRLNIAKDLHDEHGPLPMSVFYLVPQFFLVGSGEAFIYTGQLDFFITQSPAGMKTMSTGLFLTTLSLGFFVSSMLVSMVDRITGGSGKGGWLADDINKGRLDCFYWLLSGLSLVNFAVYLWCAAWFKPRPPPQDMEMEVADKGNSNGMER
ncbi:hypothetical protein AMTR_s00104p00113760 [Amborella trichopoda]|uniref:Major facilitator superfamily (MFS) profile domain-containing protein n=2 Tax=Amborella trichopoda TaxID=13333 RepID=W1NYB5_AMBTC|nr:hypothetical protein AMTR_s00104p00113760 [Amborella trichopoda]